MGYLYEKYKWKEYKSRIQMTPYKWDEKQTLLLLVKAERKVYNDIRCLKFNK